MAREVEGLETELDEGPSGLCLARVSSNLALLDLRAMCLRAVDGDSVSAFRFLDPPAFLAAGGVGVGAGARLGNFCLDLGEGLSGSGSDSSLKQGL